MKYLICGESIIQNEINEIQLMQLVSLAFIWLKLSDVYIISYL